MQKTSNIEVNGFGQIDSGEVALVIDAKSDAYNGSFMLKPSSLAGLRGTTLEESGLSELEAESTGIDANKLCERLNRTFAGGLMICSTERERLAIERLFAHAGDEPDFALVDTQQYRKSG